MSISMTETRGRGVGRGEGRSASRDWRRAFTDLRREHGFEPLAVAGTLPKDLAGTLYRNGPGMVGAFGRPYGHWFDGDGAITALRLGGGRAEGATRVLETTGLLEERRRGRAHFGAFGTPAPGFHLGRLIATLRGRAKNPSNTAVLPHAGRLYALCEIGRPFEVDPESLASLGERDFGGVILGGFSAHPHRIASDGSFINFGVRIGRPNAIDVYALRPSGGAERLLTLPLERPTLIHDFALTERHAIIFVAPLGIALLPSLFGKKSFAENLSWEPSLGTEVIVVPLAEPERARRFRTDAFWHWHVANAFDEGDELVVDLVRYASFEGTHRWLSALTAAGPEEPAEGTLARARIDPAREAVSWEHLGDESVEFPRIDPSRDGGRHRHIYLNEHSSEATSRAGLPDAITAIDLERGVRDRFVFPEGQYPSEPVLAPRAGAEREGEGWLLSLVYDARSHRSHAALLDASHVSDGPIATIDLGQHIPPTFHGSWVPA